MSVFDFWRRNFNTFFDIFDPKTFRPFPNGDWIWAMKISKILDFLRFSDFSSDFLGFQILTKSVFFSSSNSIFCEIFWNSNSLLSFETQKHYFQTQKIPETFGISTFRLFKTLFLKFDFEFSIGNNWDSTSRVGRRARARALCIASTPAGAEIWI